MVDFAGERAIACGHGVAAQVADAVLEISREVVVMTGAHPARHRWLLDSIDARVLTVEGEPTVAGLERMRNAVREKPVGVIVAIGGGAVLDMAKGAAALLTEPRPAADFFVDDAPDFTPKLPVIAVPTTNGSGSEVTMNAVFEVPERKIKLSLRHPGMRPVRAFVDPDLSRSAPDDIFFASALDALTHCGEAYLSAGATPTSDRFARAGLALAARAIPALLANRDDAAALDMAQASVLGGLALRHGGLGIAHGIAAVLGARGGPGHGTICARLMPATLVCNAHHAPARCLEMAQVIAGSGASVEQAAMVLQGWAEAAGLSRLGDVAVSDWGAVAEAAVTASSSLKNPARLNKAQIAALLEDAMEREARHVAA